MSEAPGRPAPEYGQYATPEQVAKARGMTLAEYERHLASITRPTPAPDPAPLPHAAQPDAEPAAPAATAVTPTRSINRMLTLALLAFGFVSVLLSIPSLLAMGDSAATAFEVQGLDAYTSYAAARTIGIVAVIVQLFLWLGTLALSLSLLRRGALSWWVPLAAGVLAVIIVSILWIMAIVVDPAFTAYVESISVG